jgi:cholesterol 7-dehydrogenase
LQFERDVAVWNSKKFMKNPLLVREDAVLGKYRRWFAQFYTENSPTYASVMSKQHNNLDW